MHTDSNPFSLYTVLDGMLHGSQMKSVEIHEKNSRTWLIGWHGWKYAENTLKKRLKIRSTTDHCRNEKQEQRVVQVSVKIQLKLDIQALWRRDLYWSRCCTNPPSPYVRMLDRNTAPQQKRTAQMHPASAGDRGIFPVFSHKLDIQQPLGTLSNN